MNDLTAFQRDLIRSVANLKEPSGMDIKNHLEEYYEEVINHGRLYPNLDTLVDKGLLHKGSKTERTNYYSITMRGAREVEFQYEEWKEAHDKIESRKTIEK